MSSNYKCPKNLKYYKENVRTSKQITVYLNGQQTLKYKFALDKIRTPKWHHILNEITEKVNPYFGVVKKLYSCESGVTICSFSDIENNGTYVASDNRPFQIVRGGYIAEDKNKCFEHYLSGQLERRNKVKKLSHVRCDLIVIYVFCNGKDREEPKKIVLSKEELHNWEHTLSYIALVVDLPYRNIKALYNANGHQICGPWEIQHGASYIAVGYNDKFIRRKYKIREDITEIWKNTIPVINKNKNFVCSHNPSIKSWKQKLEWRNSAEDLYDYSTVGNNCQYPFEPLPIAYNSGSSSENNSEIFNIPSEKYGYIIEDHSSKLTTPSNNSHEKRSSVFSSKA